MNTSAIQRQYDQVIAECYDRDPQDVTSNALEHAVLQLGELDCFAEVRGSMSVLDVGMGTGMFYRKLRENTDRFLLPHGLDLSERMVDIARQEIPELVAEVDDAANLKHHFVDQAFDLICTHFITGFVPFEVLAPEIHKRLDDHGVWSFVGGTAQSYPTLQSIAERRAVKWMLGGGSLDLGDMLVPENEDHVKELMEAHGFEVLRSETFLPKLQFANFDEFMEFAYHGGWLTPFIEKLGLHQIRPTLKSLLNAFVFPVEDSHRIVITTVKKQLS